MMLFHRALFLCLMLGSGLVAFSGEVNQVTGTAMGMKWSVKWMGELERANVEGLTTALLHDVERQMSTYQADSEISRFNASTGTNWFPVSTNLARVVDLSLEIAQKTDGALDPTVFPLVQVWGFGPGRRLGQMPTVKEITTAKARVGHTNLQSRLRPPALRKLRPDVAVDVSAVAMGYAADLLQQTLSRKGGTNFLVDMGGEFVARGAGPDGKGWMVGIEQPGSNGRRIQRSVTLRDESLATSGDDRNFREINGRRYHHIIDPRTGSPAEMQIGSATVIHSSCAQADGWATAMVVMGSKHGLEKIGDEKLRLILIERDRSGFREVASPPEDGH